MSQRRSSQTYRVYDVHTDQAIGVLQEGEYQRFLADLRALSRGRPCRGLDGSAYGFKGHLIDVIEAQRELQNGPPKSRQVVHYASGDDNSPCPTLRPGEPQGPLLAANCPKCLAAVARLRGTPLFHSELREGRVEVIRLAGCSVYTFPFHRECVNNLKDEIPKEGRRWLSTAKKWCISLEFQPHAEEILARYFGERSWRRALHLLALTSSATPGQIYISWLLRRQVGGAAAREFDECLATLTDHYAQDLVARAKIEFAELRLD